MIRLYLKTPLFRETTLGLDPAQSHYLQHVMRLKKEDELLVFNGRDGEWIARIRDIGKKSAILQVISQQRPQPKERDTWLLFSPLKPRYQAFLEEKATELGVGCLWPVQCDRTYSLKFNREKTEAHLREAAEQSGRLTLPSLHPCTPLRDLLKTWPRERVLVFGDETLNSPSLDDIPLDAQKSYAFLVGPEGGFTPQEQALLREHPNCQGVILNSNILRAETAALVGLSYLHLKFLFREK